MPTENLVNSNDSGCMADMWKEIQDKSVICDPFQTFEWSEVMKRSLNLSPRFLVIGGGAGGVVSTERNLLIPQLRYVEIRGGPLCLPDSENKVLKGLIRYLNERRNCLFKVIQPSPLISSKFKSLGLKAVHPRTCTFLLRTRIKKNDLWNSVDKKARWGVRKAERLGVRVEEATLWTQWETYYSLHRKHSMAHNLAAMPLSFFRNVFNVLCPNKMALLLIASLDNRLIAGSLFLIHRWYMIYLQNASLPEFLPFQPNNLIQWKSIQWANSNGVEIYDLGGVADPSLGDPFLGGVYDFKKRWGGRLTSYDYFAFGKVYQFGASFFYNSETARRMFWSFRNMGAI